MWGQLSLETMQAAREIDFRFFFASGTLLCYSWTVPNEFSEARLAAGLFHFAQCSTNFWHRKGKTVLSQFPGLQL